MTNLITTGADLFNTTQTPHLAFLGRVLQSSFNSPLIRQVALVVTLSSIWSKLGEAFEIILIKQSDFKKWQFFSSSRLATLKIVVLLIIIKIVEIGFAFFCLATPIADLTMLAINNGERPVKDLFVNSSDLVFGPTGAHRIPWELFPHFQVPPDWKKSADNFLDPDPKPEDEGHPLELFANQGLDSFCLNPPLLP